LANRDFVFIENSTGKMAVDRKDANLNMLAEAHDTQDKTKEAIWRIQKQTNEAEEIGNQTLEELRRQGQQMVR
jgi:hypothetical protein